MRKIVTLTALMLIALFLYESASAYPGGRTGATRKSGTSGCSCHTNNATTTSTLTGPDTVMAGATVTYTLTYSGSNSGLYGVDIAAQRGTLAVGASGAYLHLASGELTHSQGLSVTTLTFSYTAPSTVGWDTLYSTVDKGYSGRWAFTPNKRIVITTPSSLINLNETVESYNLSQNYPNPFNPVTKIQFSIAKSSDVTLKVYDATGKEVINLVNQQMNAGLYSVTWDASAVPSGVYFYKLKSGNFTETKRMVLVK